MAATDPAARADAIAREYSDAYYHQFPEEAFEIGYPDTPWDRLGDRSVEAIAAWEAREDAWLAELRGLDAEAVRGTDAWIPYTFLVQRLEAATARRVCRMELWNVSPTWTGWQSMLPSTFAVQPVGDAETRADALARLHDVPRYLNTLVANLREGVRQGYTAPQSGVDAVLGQVDGMLEAPVEDSPFYNPAARDGDPEFAEQVATIVRDEIRPAITSYRDYLRDEYRAAARTEVGVSANPGGQDCYRASVTFWSSLSPTPDEIHQAGLRQMERIEAEMTEIARRSFGTDDVHAVLERLRTDTAYTFRTADDVLAYARAAVERGKAAVPDWFGFVPDAEVIVKPFPAFQKQSGGGFYSAGAQDGSRPGTYELGTYLPETISRAGMESTAYHETYPGHHLQMSVALARSGLHPLLQYFYSAGMAEGWGLYSEALAEEMGLYTSDVDRMGRLSNAALRAARLVVDPGMHALGWTRQQAIEYMLEHTAEGANSVAGEIDRYIAVPGQATSYMLGSLEIQRLRSDAEQRLGEAFDIKAFHDRVLADGAVSLPMLGDNIEAWVQEQQRADGS
jgi:uncharacterized protein (DUF885 family)